MSTPDMGGGGAGVSEANGVLHNHYYPFDVIQKRKEANLKVSLFFHFMML